MKLTNDGDSPDKFFVGTIKWYALRCVTFFGLFLLVSVVACNDDVDDDNNVNPVPKYHASGKITDSLGIGLNGIKINVEDKVVAVTNPQGLWTTSDLLGTAWLEPLAAGYVFLPAKVRVSKDTSNVTFIRHDLHQHLLSNDVLEWFKRIQLSNGLLESSEGSNFVSLYDNSLSALVFIAHGDYAKAEAIFDFFDDRIDSELRAGTGGFAQFRDRNGTPTSGRWLGDNAWLLIALNNYAAKVNAEKYAQLASAMEQWIRKLQDLDGGIWQGYDSYGNPVGKVTENMIDAFNAVPGYDKFHAKLLTYLRNYRWDPDRKILLSWPGSEYELALDNHTWGYCGIEGMPRTAVDEANCFITTKASAITHDLVTGFCCDVDRDQVWYEGTGQMVVALQKAGEGAKANYFLSEIEKGIMPSEKFSPAKGIPYSTNRGTGYGSELLWVGADTKPCISSAAWYLFGVWKFDPLVAGYNKNIPIEDKF